MSSSIAVTRCSRCGQDGHVAAACAKSFFRSECSFCHRMGHTVSTCPKKRAVEYEQRQARREEGPLAYEERQQKREEREARLAVARAAEEAREKERSARSEKWAERAAAQERDQSSACLGGDAASVYSGSTADTNPAAHEERTIKKLEKKLREIAKLKECAAHGGTLDKLQSEKVGTEADILMQIEDTRALAEVRMRHAKKQEW
ncbi:Chaperone protein ClpC2 [Amphidinium carterae]